MITPAIEGEREKRWAASTSVIAAVGLTTFKLVIGLSTGSLGILAEAAHSGLDLAAAVMTLVAVRLAGRPADRTHTYGHGKFENLSALFETGLLLITCLWIIKEAVERLISKDVAIEVSAWSFLVMITSIVVDFSRSRVLYRAAMKHKSQALEADALHFRTDIWSSSVVLAGLASVLIAHRVPSWSVLHYADSVAALIVALICFYVIYDLGMRAVHALLDSAPEGLQERIRAAAESVAGVVDCHNVRIRTSGPHSFVDVHILVNGALTLQQAHDLTEQVETAIQSAVPGADVTVHPEPDERAAQPAERARGLRVS